jgi:hypothetical protein
MKLLVQVAQSRADDCRRMAEEVLAALVRRANQPPSVRAASENPAEPQSCFAPRNLS